MSITRRSAVNDLRSLSSDYALSAFTMDSPTSSIGSDRTLFNKAVHFREDDAGSIVNSGIDDPLDYEERCGSPSDHLQKLRDFKQTLSEKQRRAGLTKKEKFKERAGKMLKKTGLRKDKKTDLDAFAASTFSIAERIARGTIYSMNNTSSSNVASVNDVRSVDSSDNTDSVTVQTTTTQTLTMEITTTTTTTISSLSTCNMDANQIQQRFDSTTSISTAGANSVTSKQNKFKKFAAKIGDKFKKGQESELYN